jgi:predicted dehydrogenase
MKRTRAAAATLAAAISSTASAAPLRVCVVGAGSIGREFALHHFGPSTNTVVSSIIDVDFEAARALAADVGSVQSGASVVGDSKYQATVSSCEGEPVATGASLDASALTACDVVYVGTPPASHRALVLAALDAGKHVLLEKPVAASGADADAIVEAAEAAAVRGVRVGMNIGMRWNAALRQMRRLAVEEGALGPLQSGHIALHFAQWPRAWQTVPWCAGRAQGGPLREVGTHFLFGLCELLGHGAARRVRAAVTYPDGASGERAEVEVEGEIEMAGGLRVALSVRTDGSGLAADGEDHYELGVRGAQGALLLDGFTTLKRTAPSRRKATLVEGGGYGRKECVAALLAAVAAGGVGGGEAARGEGGSGGAEGEAVAAELITAREGRNAQRLVDALTASGGEWVDVLYD